MCDSRKIQQGNKRNIEIIYVLNVYEIVYIKLSFYFV